MTYRSQNPRWHIIVAIGGLIAVAAVAFILGTKITGQDQPASVSLGEGSTSMSTSASSYLTRQEVILVPSNNGEAEGEMLPVERVEFAYAEVVSSCSHNFEGECVHAYAGPGTEYATVTDLRTDMVLNIGGQVHRSGDVWYKITFDNQWLRYPERVTSDWYVNADNVAVLFEEGPLTSWEDESHVATNTDKRIVVNRSTNMLQAYEGDALFMETPISAGLQLTPTPLGTYTIFKKMPSRYMQGPVEGIPSDDHYDLPGVPWNLYFTEGGAVIHGAYWHNSFGSAYSHGCVNLPSGVARKLYNWAPLGTTVTVTE